MPTPARILTHNGKSLSIEKWSQAINVPVETIRCRIDRLGWTVARALDTPPDRRFRRGGRPRSDRPRPVPNLRRDAAKDCAFARWRAFGRDNIRYFGQWGSPEAVAKYRRFASEWAAGSYESAATAAGGLFVADLADRWLSRCEREYRKGGRLTSEYHCHRAAMLVLNDLYGDLPASEFTPANLRAVRVAMVGKKWSRSTVNGHIGRVVRMFGWAVGESLVPAGVVHALREVEHLKAGREAPDRPKVKPATPEQIEAVMPHLSPVPARRGRLEAMIRVQRLTGMRPGEVCAMRIDDLDRSCEVWLYTVPDLANKNLHRGKPQRYYIGPKAQALLTSHLAHAKPGKPIFRTARDSYGKAIRYACRKAGVPVWHPHQLRHALATDVARQFQSTDAAAAAIGDTPETAGRVYVHIDPTEKARIEVAKRMG
ncbi:MAG: tyrosine-type recombinase/integrase [Gemmataceae bacterium]